MNTWTTVGLIFICLIVGGIAGFLFNGGVPIVINLTDSQENQIRIDEARKQKEAVSELYIELDRKTEVTKDALENERMLFDKLGDFKFRLVDLETAILDLGLSIENLDLNLNESLDDFNKTVSDLNCPLIED